MKNRQRRKSRSRKSLCEIARERLEDASDIVAARAALRDAEKYGTIPWETLKKELGLK